MEKRNEILELSFEFSIKVIDFCEQLLLDRRFVIGNQLLKAATSIGANVREAQSPHSRNDFISKMVIASKEARETEYWLLLCQVSPHYPNPHQLLDMNLSIKKLLSKIISSSRGNQDNQNK